MHDTSEFDWGTMEEHCYFPEWADRPPIRGSLHEVDRNSYLAGGYAEEFGHRARPLPAQALSIPVEDDAEWRVHIGGLHPGYPECPRPLDRELLPHSGSAGPGERPRARQAAEQPQRKPAGFRVILVGQDDDGRPRHRPWIAWRKFRIRRKRLPLG
jgi:hypothetical protein